MPITIEHRRSPWASGFQSFMGGRAEGRRQNAQMQQQYQMQERRIQAQQTGQMFNNLMGIAQQQMGIQARANMQDTAYTNAFSLIGEQEKSAINQATYKEFGQTLPELQQDYTKWSQTPEGMDKSFPDFTGMRRTQLAQQKYVQNLAAQGYEMGLDENDKSRIQGLQSDIHILDQESAMGRIDPKDLQPIKLRKQQELQRAQQKHPIRKFKPPPMQEQISQSVIPVQGYRGSFWVTDPKTGKITIESAKPPTGGGGIANVYDKIMTLPPEQAQVALKDLWNKMIIEIDDIPVQFDKKEGQWEVVKNWKKDGDGFENKYDDAIKSIRKEKSDLTYDPTSDEVVDIILKDQNIKEATKKKVVERITKRKTWGKGYPQLELDKSQYTRRPAPTTQPAPTSISDEFVGPPSTVRLTSQAKEKGVTSEQIKGLMNLRSQGGSRGERADAILKSLGY